MDTELEIMTGKGTQNSSNPGSYSVSVKSFFSSWKQKSDKKPIETDKKRKKILKPVVNPIFEKCASITDDEYWKIILTECSLGKFPRYFSFKPNLLTYRKGNKMISLELSKSPSNALLDVLEFFQKFGGLLSEKDRLRMKKLEEEKLLEKLNRDTDITWKDIKTEKMKNILIIEFVESLNEKLNFTEDERKELITIIKKGFMLKYFTASNIEMDNGRIKEIEGLIIDYNTKEFEIDPYYITERTGRKYIGLGIEESKKKPDVNFLDVWTKYLNGLENKRIKKIYTYSSSAIQNEDESYDCSKTDLSMTS